MPCRRRGSGTRVRIIDGFDQGPYFSGAPEAEPRGEVRRCLAEAGERGGCILWPADPFFDAGRRLIALFADAAKGCSY